MIAIVTRRIAKTLARILSRQRIRPRRPSSRRCRRIVPIRLVARSNLGDGVRELRRQASHDGERVGTREVRFEVGVARGRLVAIGVEEGGSRHSWGRLGECGGADVR